MDIRRLADMMSATLSEDKNQRDAAEEQLKQVKLFRKHAMCYWIFFLLKMGDSRSNCMEFDCDLKVFVLKVIEIFQIIHSTARCFIVFHCLDIFVVLTFVE